LCWKFIHFFPPIVFFFFIFCSLFTLANM
jgi:hypothetical protein